MRNAVLFGILLIAGVSANMGFLSPSGSNIEGHSESLKPSSGKAAPAGDISNDEDYPLRVLYALDYPNQGPSFTSTSPLCPDLKHTLVPVSNMDFLIATVPDPERTHLSVMLDRHLEAILFAAQDAGYLFDSYWLPWQMGPDHDSQFPGVRQENEKEKQAREQLPGLLLFRKGVTSRRLAVFLVGELPTSGVNRQQFYRASCFIEQLDPLMTDYKGILGPMFSGSESSLHEARRETFSDFKLPLTTQVISGTATGVGPSAVTTVNRDSDACQTLVDALPGWKPLAILSEDGTGYGGTSGGTSGSMSTCQSAAMIYYPREISRLRNASQNNQASTNRPGIQTPSLLPQLPLSLDDATEGRDTLPEFSVQQSPASQESILLQIASKLKQDRIEAVVVRGTNVLDALFLSRFLRQCCADIRVAILDSDLLFIHGTDSLDFLGVVSVSSYPSSLSVRKAGSAGLHVFNSNLEEGAYYACLRLLNTKEGNQDELYRDYGTLTAGSKTSRVWISVVGRGGYFTVAHEGSDGLSVGYPTRVWNVVFFLSAVVLLAGTVAYLHATRSRGVLETWCADFHPAPDLHPSGKRLIFHFAMTVSILAAWCTLGFPVVDLAWVRQEPHWQLAASVAVLVAFALAYVAARTIDTVQSKKFPTYARRATVGISAAGILAILAAANTWHPQGMASTEAFRSLRSVDLSSGVSPAVPLIMLFAVLAYMSWISMQRFILAEERDPEPPDSSGESYYHPLLRAGATFRINDLLTSWNPFAGWTFVALVTGVFSGLGAWTWFSSLEGPVYRILFLSLFTLCAGLLAAAVWQYLELWRRFRRFLQALNLHPVRHALLALPAVQGWSPLWQTSIRKRSYAIPQRAMECLQKLHKLAPTYYEERGAGYVELAVEHLEFKDDVDSLQGSVAEIVKLESLGLHLDSTVTRRLSRNFTRVADRLQHRLFQTAWSEGSSESFEKIETAHPADKVPGKIKQPDLLAAEFVALRYVAFIRYVMLHLKNKLSFLTCSFLLLAIALNSYPFGGETYFRWWLTGTFAVLGCVTILIFLDMERDETLSRLTDTKTNQIAPDFYGKLISAGILPLLAVISSLFPAIGRYLFAWVQPAITALH